MNFAVQSILSIYTQLWTVGMWMLHTNSCMHWIWITINVVEIWLVMKVHGNNLWYVIMNFEAPMQFMKTQFNAKLWTVGGIDFSSNFSHTLHKNYNDCCWTITNFMHSCELPECECFMKIPAYINHEVSLMLLNYGNSLKFVGMVISRQRTGLTEICELNVFYNWHKFHRIWVYYFKF